MEKEQEVLLSLPSERTRSTSWPSVGKQKSNYCVYKCAIWVFELEKARFVECENACFVFATQLC